MTTPTILVGDEIELPATSSFGAILPDGAWVKTMFMVVTQPPLEGKFVGDVVAVGYTDADQNTGRCGLPSHVQDLTVRTRLLGIARDGVRVL